MVEFRKDSKSAILKIIVMPLFAKGWAQGFILEITQAFIIDLFWFVLAQQAVALNQVKSPLGN